MEQIRIIQFYLLILKKESVIRCHTSELKTTNSSPVVKLLPLYCLQKASA